MLAYLVLIAVPSAFALTGAGRRNVQFAVLASCIVMGCLSAFRLNVGMDWNNYLFIWQSTEGLSLQEIIKDRDDLAWSILLYGGRPFYYGLTGINVFSGVVFSYGMYRLLSECEEPMIGLLAALPILVLTLAMSAVRQSIAVGIEMIVIANWYRWRLSMKAVGLLAAALFHFSATALLLLLVFDVKLTGFRRNVIVGASLALFIAFLMLSSRTNVYSDMYVSSDDITQSSGVYYHMTFLVVPYGYYLFRRKEWIERFGRVAFLDVMAVAMMLCLLAAPISSTAADRFSLFLWPGAIIIYSSIPAMMRRTQLKTGIRILAVILSVSSTIGWLLLSNSRLAYVPYQSVFISATDRVRGSGPLQ